MAIVNTINFGSFVDAFHVADRYDQFEYDGLRVLFDYLDDVGEPVEIDVIGICCDYSHDTLQEIADNYNIDLSDIDPDDPDSMREIVREYLEENTIVCGETDAGFVYALF